MPIETIKFREFEYPKFQAEGNAAQFVLPYIKHVCKGRGFDIEGIVLAVISSLPFQVLCF